MGMRPLPLSANIPAFANPLWFSTDPTLEDRELYYLEKEISEQLERVEQKHCDLVPIGASAVTEVKLPNYVDVEEDEEEDDDDDDDMDDDESESHDDDNEEETEVDVGDQGQSSPPLF